jgi:phage regulator Rha-like protein
LDNLVFLEPNKIDAIPFTTSDVIAEFAEIKHHAVQQMISKHESSLEAFGQVVLLHMHEAQIKKKYIISMNRKRLCLLRF